MSEHMVGDWQTIESRTMDVVLRITTVKVVSKSGRKRTTSEYRATKIPLAPGTSEVAAWRFDKTLPEVDRYTVTLHQDGRLTCDCPHGTYRAEESGTLCPHASAVLTLADFSRELVVPPATS
jgi:hypothetical protein